MQFNLQEIIKKRNCDEEKKQMFRTLLHAKVFFFILDLSIIDVGIPLKILFNKGGVGIYGVCKNS